MSGFTTRVLAVSAVVAALAACSDLNGINGNTVAMSAAFRTVPAGFSANSSSFDASGDDGMPFLPFDMGGSPMGFDGGGHHGPGGGDGGRHGDHHDGFGPDSMPGRMMGGGLGPEFLGGIPFGHGRGRGPFGSFDLPDTCTFDSASGRVSCPDRTERGLTIRTSFAFTDEAGTAQARFDSLTTNTVNVKTDVSGTRSRHDGQITSTLTHTSDRTISGLAAGKTERTVNGTSKAHEEINGTRDSVSFSAVRDAADTTTGLVVPIVDGRPTIPSAGTVVRTMSVSITRAGGTATSRTRREEVTFNGTNVVKVKVTQDGVTQSCTVTLPDRKLVCG